MTPLRKTQCWKGLRRASGLLRRIFPLTRVGAALAVVDGFALWAEGLRHQNLVVLGAAAVVLAIQCGLTLVVIAFIGNSNPIGASGVGMCHHVVPFSWRHDRAESP